MIAATTTITEVEIPISERGPSPRKVIVAYGFWLFLLSDIIIFSALFAAYAVLSGRSADGPTGVQLFHRNNVLIETGCLLLSSFTCAMMSLAIEVRRRGLMVVGAVLTLALVGLGGVVAAGLARAWQTEHEFEVSAAEMATFAGTGARA